jgi:hypothetical protein
MPDLDQPRSAVLNSLTAPGSQASYDEFLLGRTQLIHNYSENGGCLTNECALTSGSEPPAPIGGMAEGFR